MENLSLDIETYSSEDLAKAGVYRYAESPDFTVLLIGYSFDDGLVTVLDLASGAAVPPDLVEALLSPSVEKRAFNAAFERICLSRLLRDLGYLAEGEFLPPAAWRCTMVHCAAMGLPMSLAGAGAVLGLDKQKLAEGKDLVRFFCRPAAGGQGERNLPSADPERWEQFKAYNRRDVEAETEIRRKLAGYPVPESVWAEYELDQAVNDRGIRVDTGFVTAALEMDRASRAELARKLCGRTGIANPNSVPEIRGWLEEHGQEAKSLTKAGVKEMLETASPEAKEVLQLRQQLGKTSVRKYAAMAGSVCRDGRVRGMFQFHGAARSGRWAGRLVQMQNLPQNHLPALEDLRTLVKTGDYSSLKTLYDSVPDVLSELIRTAFIPAEGKKFIVCDFSAIEARVIAWLAGEGWRREVFAAGGDIYCASASAMFHVPVEKHGVNSELRQKGKIAELALGYGGGTGALRAMGAMEMGVPEAELQPLVDAWRNANPNICRLWKEVDRAVKTAVREKTTVGMKDLRFSYRAGWLLIRLPSGRALAYAQPGLCENRFGGESVCYMGTGTTKKWEKIESYGPKFVENIVQGIARDLLANAMKNLEGQPLRPLLPALKRGQLAHGNCYPDQRSGQFLTVAHVHDEVILEADPWVTVDEIAEKMAVCPDWAKGLLLKADGYECCFYRKD